MKFRKRKGASRRPCLFVNPLLQSVESVADAATDPGQLEPRWTPLFSPRLERALGDGQRVRRLLGCEQKFFRRLAHMQGSHEGREHWLFIACVHVDIAPAIGIAAGELLAAPTQLFRQHHCRGVVVPPGTQRMIP